MSWSARQGLAFCARVWAGHAELGLGAASELSVREILQHLGAPEDIAAEALAAAPRPPARWRLPSSRWRLAPGRWYPASGPLNRRTLVSMAATVAVLAAVRPARICLCACTTDSERTLWQPSLLPGRQLRR